MKVNNYSILNRWRNCNSNSANSKLIKSANNLVEKKLSAQMNDSINIETSKKLIANMEKLSSIVEIDRKKVEQLVSDNNVLNLSNGSFYKLHTSNGTTAIFTVDDNGNAYMPFNELGLDENFTLTPTDYNEISKTSRLISSLLQDSSAFLVRTGGYSNKEVKDILGSIGIKPGWFEVKSSSQDNKFYLVDNGLVYPEYQVEAERRAFNQRNWFNDGFTTDSVFTIEGKHYKLDKSGHLNVPKGVGCIMDNTVIKK
ncbi:hypothetical protein JHL18_14995 [Clostridium sp. YIM B02505]|uniref:Uncharacterized protein n=1 Tax=Clostridium yunnanense TaxID=2800325 RepID=A0ABS1ERB9_9CLOT|nr:hypothetical protein [Clostridium yunnanense]MBK1811926.1 hypothetical protein [Clostridium yunnanense]